jgi:Regulator of ribonuclease activity B
MRDGSDSLTKLQLIDCCFAFPEREQAINFARAVTEKDLEVRLFSCEECGKRQATVKKFMVPGHAAIGELEAELTRRAILAGVEADGRGCMRIPE